MTAIFSQKNQVIIKDIIINVSLNSICPIIGIFTNSSRSFDRIYRYTLRV